MIKLRTYMTTPYRILLFAFFLTLLGGCKGHTLQPGDGTGTNPFELNIPNSFLFSSTNDVTIEITSALKNGQPISGVIYHIFDADPDNGGKRLSSFYTDASGTVNTSLPVPSWLEEVHITTDFIGIENHAIVPVNGNRIVYHYAPVSAAANRGSETPDLFQAASAANKAGLMNVTLTPIGTWDETNGRPNYLTLPDELDMNFLNRVNSLLVLRQSVPDNHPHLLDPTIPRDLHLIEDGQVWVTFLGSGSGWNNALGFYTYTDDTRPQTANEIDTHYLIFPRARPAQGALLPGDRVQLPGPGPDGLFPAGTYIGWFLIGDAWKPDNDPGERLTNGRLIHYSDRNLNTQTSNPDLREQLVVVYDVEESKLVLGWEDLRRGSGADNDFNDVMFYATWNPPGAVDTNGVPVVGDPDAPARKIYNFGPAEDRFGTLLFEDMWPFYGDYDLNDLVVSYQTMETANANNNIEEIELTLVLRAAGAAVRNGIGFQFNNVPPSNVAGVSGNRLTTGNISLNANGTESGQQWANIIAFDDANYNMPSFGNVYPARTHVDYDTVRVTVQFVNPVPKAILGNSPFNVYSFRTQERDREIHLPGRRPTSLANTSYFGTHDDNTNPDSGRFYISNGNMNWALNVPYHIPYPQENSSFTQAYTRFGDWAESGGKAFPDWYKNLPGYRNQSVLYINPNGSEENGGGD